VSKCKNDKINLKRWWNAFCLAAGVGEDGGVPKNVYKCE
jgi:hypothetical protein